MARRLIGLDVGTNAVTIAEVTPGDPPRLDMFAQVALPRESMREGEVADEAAVAQAVERLRTEVGMKKAAVRVGIASPRVVVRQVEMPLMTRSELASALQFQAGELIPIPIDEAVLDFVILENTTSSSGEPTMQVLLAAAYESTVTRLVSAIEAGGLSVEAVDLIPLALTRALGRTVPAMALAAAGGVAVDDAIGAEAIVSFGGGVTSIAVHERGIPRFVRVIGSGGRELTDAIANELNLPSETAEALKRQLSSQQSDELAVRAQAAIDRPVSVLLDEVRSSIDYYRNQPGSARLLRVVTTGGSSQLRGLPERLSALVGVPVEPARPSDMIRIGNIGFPPEDIPRLEPYLPAPVGLALADSGIAIDLRPKHRHQSARKLNVSFNPKIGAIAGVALVVLGGLTFQAKQSVSSAKSKQTKAETEVLKLQSEIARLSSASSIGGKAGLLQADIIKVLSGDVAWNNFIRGVGASLPPGVVLTTFEATETPSALTSPSVTSSPGVTSGGGAITGPINTARNTANATSTQQNNLAANAGSSTPGGAGVVPATAVASCDLQGTVTMTGSANDMPSIAAFIDALSKDKAVTNVWLQTATAVANADGSRPTFTFTVGVDLAPGARSARIEQYLKGATCS